MAWKSAHSLTNDELRDFVAQLAGEVITLRRTLALVAGMLLAADGAIEEPPDEVREELLDGIRVFMERALDASAAEDEAMHQLNAEAHRYN